MPENKKFRLRPKAEEDLENIYEYSYREFGSARADQYIRDLDAAFHKLADEPSLGSDYSHVHLNLMAYKVVSHVVFFKPSVDGITILRVLHKSMDYGRHL
jgi:toxin ParE1/3/4